MVLNKNHMEQSKRAKEVIFKQPPTSVEAFAAQFNRKNPNWKPPSSPETSATKNKQS